MQCRVPDTANDAAQKPVLDFEQQHLYALHLTLWVMSSPPENEVSAMTKTMAKFVLGLSVTIGSLGWAQSTPAQASPQSDNTKINERDRDMAQPTADQQKENKSDRETARQIRRAIVQDKSLSTYAQNVKIILQNGTVTLKGPVRSAEEKQAIEKMAAKVAGAANVKSEIQVKAGEEASR